MKGRTNLEQLKIDVFNSNMALVKHQLITLTWGNVSGIDREKGLVVIKPSGVSYSSMKPSDMVVVDLNGNVIEGKYSPSSDTPTHLELYKNFPMIGGVVHTHSTFATSFAQAHQNIIPYGTTHADTFHGAIPLTRELNAEEIENNYELHTGRVIVEAFKNVSYEEIPAVIVSGHGPFVWGKTPKNAVENAVILEEVAKMAYLTKTINPTTQVLQQRLMDKHYFRKHGINAYYGQKESK